MNGYGPVYQAQSRGLPFRIPSAITEHGFGQSTGGHMAKSSHPKACETMRGYANPYMVSRGHPASHRGGVHCARRRTASVPLAPPDSQQPRLGALSAHPGHPRTSPRTPIRIHEPQEIGTGRQTTRVTEAVRAAQAQKQRQQGQQRQPTQ